MSDVLDPSLVCRDENCPRIGAHRAHLSPKTRVPRAHHRPKNGGDAWRVPWLKDDPEGLRQSVQRAACDGRPHVFAEIVRDVRDDYGTITVRSIHRRLKELVERGKLLSLDLGFTFNVYIDPAARLLRDPETIREIIIGEHDFGPSCTAKSRYEASA